jgi:hypothetical protein
METMPLEPLKPFAHRIKRDKMLGLHGTVARSLASSAIDFSDKEWRLFHWLRSSHRPQRRWR